MKLIFTFVLAVATMPLLAEEIYQVRSDGVRDYSKPSYMIDGDKIYQRRPNGERDYTKTSYVMQGDKVYRQRLDGEPDYTKPSRKVR